MLSKSLVQFSVDVLMRGCVPSLLFDLRPNYGGGNEDNGDLLQMVLCTHCRTRCPRPCSRPLTHASARDAWTLTGEPGSVSRGVTAPVSWVLVHTRFCLCHQESVSQSCVSSGGSVVGLTATSSKRASATPRPLRPEPLPLRQATAAPDLLRRHSDTVLAQSLWASGSWCAQGLFGPSEHLWWVWSLILNVISPLLPSCWGFCFALGSGVSFWWDPAFSCQQLFSSEL